MSPNMERRPGTESEASQGSLAATASVPDAPTDAATTRARCLACHRPIVAAESVRLGFGPVCFTRITNAQRHARAEALHRRLWALLRRLHSLDARALAMLSAALDDLDAEGMAT